MNEDALDPSALFGAYMRVTGVPRLDHDRAEDADLQGKSLGLINGSSWITLWANWFGRQILPGVKLVNAGNEAVQLNFMRAHRRGDPVPPAENVEAFSRYAVDLATLYPVDAILLTCSTMNRAYPAVRDAVSRWAIPVVQIDRPMMVKAVRAGRRILVVATHGPTVENTKALLRETAAESGKSIEVECATAEEAFNLLGDGDIRGHNEAIGHVIRKEVTRSQFDVVVLAQLSMSVFALSYPDRQAEFGVPILTSGEEGFFYIKEVLRAAAR